MKRLIIFLAILTMATGARAADPTTELLSAPLVNDSITLSLGKADGKTIVRYTLDLGAVDKAADGKTFRSKDEVAIFIHRFNPLTQTWVVDSKATPDVNYAAIKDFLDDLSGLQKALAPAGGSGAGFTGEESPTNRKKPKPPTACEKLMKLVQAADAALNSTALGADALESIVTGATGFAGIKNADNQLAAAQDTIVTDNSAAREALDTIRKEFGTLGKQPEEGQEEVLPAFECKNITSKILVDYIQVHSTADQIITAKEQLRAQIGDLRKSLQPFLVESEWRADDRMDYRIRSVTPTFAEQQEVSVKAKKRTVALDDGSLSVTTDDDHEISGKFTVRKHSFFVPERAVAVVYNTLTYPEYGTETTGSGDSEKTVVKRVEDHEPVDGAMMLNLVTRVGGGSVAYPFLQLGVSSAKDFPGFLAGVGMRFVEPFNFSLSVGGMITRYKDLDGKLKVGDPVSGTAEIKDNLVYKTSDVRLYGAIQVKF